MLVVGPMVFSSQNSEEKKKELFHLMNHAPHLQRSRDQQPLRRVLASAASEPQRN